MSGAADYVTGYASRRYELLEDLAEAADRTPKGPKRDVAIAEYLEALRAVAEQRAAEAHGRPTLPTPGRRRITRKRVQRVRKARVRRPRVAPKKVAA